MTNSFFVFTKKELIYIICIFILGIILGSTLLNIFIGRKIDLLIYENNEYKDQIEKKEIQIENLNQTLNQYRKRFINSVKIELETDINKHNQQAIKDEINKLLSNTIGQEINKIDPLLLRDIVNNRIIPVEDKKYYLKLICLVIDDQLKLYFKVNTDIDEKGE
ncbi:MAG: hypothetical protein ACOCRZ_03775 [Halothermotrichaceae bacterium]